MDASQSWCRSCVAVLRLTVRLPTRTMTHDLCNAKFAETWLSLTDFYGMKRWTGVEMEFGVLAKK